MDINRYQIQARPFVDNNNGHTNFQYLIHTRAGGRRKCTAGLKLYYYRDNDNSLRTVALNGGLLQ